MPYLFLSYLFPSSAYMKGVYLVYIHSWALLLTHFNNVCHLIETVNPITFNCWYGFKILILLFVVPDFILHFFGFIQIWFYLSPFSHLSLFTHVCMSVYIYVLLSGYSKDYNTHPTWRYSSLGIDIVPHWVRRDPYNHKILPSHPPLLCATIRNNPSMCCKTR